MAQEYNDNQAVQVKSQQLKKSKKKTAAKKKQLKKKAETNLTQVKTQDAVDNQEV